MFLFNNKKLNMSMIHNAKAHPHTFHKKGKNVTY